MAQKAMNRIRDGVDQKWIKPRSVEPGHLHLTQREVVWPGHGNVEIAPRFVGAGVAGVRWVTRRGRARVVEAHPRPVEAGARRSDLGGHVRQTHREVGQSRGWSAPQIEEVLIKFEIKLRPAN